MRYRSILTFGYLFVLLNIDINPRDDDGWLAWHIAAFWRSYDVLHEIMRAYGTCAEQDTRINSGVLAHGLSQDEHFYKKVILN